MLLSISTLVDPILKAVKNVVKHFDKRVSGLIPESSHDVISYQGLTEPEDIARKLADGTVTQRTLDWIKSEGKCLDNLVPQVSTVPHAGRGAFAQRLIAKGESVVFSPLLQMMDHTTLNIYDYEIDKEGNPVLLDVDDDEPIGYQLIVNYCLSHQQTSMFFCPQTNGILINHCSTRQSYGGDCERYNKNEDPSLRGANAEMRWAADWDPDTEEWLTLSVDEIDRRVENGKRGLSIDIIATRDINPGDEVSCSL